MTTQVKPYHKNGGDSLQDLVPKMPAEHDLPIPDGTVKTLFYWAMDLDISQGARMVLLTVIRHVGWADGAGCSASIPTLAREAHLSERSTKGHLKVLISAGLIFRKRRMSRANETMLATSQLVKELPSTVGEAASPTSQCSGFTTNQSSSSNPSNQRVTKPASTSDKPETTKTTKTKTTKSNNALEEEKTTKTTKPTSPMAHAGDVDAWLEANMPASPTGSFASAMLKHYKKYWWKPFVSDGWNIRKTIGGATDYYTNNLDTWQQLRVDLRDKLLVGGLPPDLDHKDGKPTLREKVICEHVDHQGDKLTLAYGEQTTVFRRVEGPAVIDQCNDCLKVVK